MMKNYKKYVILSAALVLTAGVATQVNRNQIVDLTSIVSAQTTDETYFTQRDLDASYDTTTASTITLEGSSATVSGERVSVDGTVVTISQEGTYIVTGTTDSVQLLVAAPDDAKVQIVLNGVTMTTQDAPVVVETADKVFLTLADGTVNSLSDGTTRTDEEIDGVIFTRSDLTINGNGELIITGNYHNGIEGKDDIRITGGTITITAVNHGINTNDAVNIQGAVIEITAGKDGIHSENNDDTTLGNVYLNPTSLTITATSDGIDAYNLIEIVGGTIQILQSDEGIEASVIHQTEGDVTINSTDDGLNASDGSSSSEGFGLQANTNLEIIIDGGTLMINAEGDGIDSNGSLTINGGSVYVEGSQIGGNGAIDANGNTTLTGGTVIAIGTADMAQGFDTTSTQASISTTVNASAGSEILIKDTSGNILASYTSQKSFQSIIATVDGMTEGTTYIVEVEGVTQEVVAQASTGGGMMGGLGGRRMMQPSANGNGQQSGQPPMNNGGGN